MIQKIPSLIKVHEDERSALIRASVIAHMDEASLRGYVNNLTDKINELIDKVNELEKANDNS